VINIKPQTGITVPPGKRLKLVTENNGGFAVLVSREGLSGRAIFILSVIIFWLLMIMAWAIMLGQYGVAWSLLSLPFWALGIITLLAFLKMIRLHQSVEIKAGKLLIQKTYNGVTSYAELNVKEITSVSLVEGTYKTLAGISRKGIYPAFISKGEAYGIGELCSREEKQWLVNTLKSVLE
jgi:hypothetical protein